MSDRIQPNKVNLRKWVQALRSGDYEQGMGRLCVIDGERDSYCCLGVACEAAIADGVDITVTQRLSCLCCSNSIMRKDFNCHSNDLPPSVMEWLGLTRSNPNLLVPNLLVRGGSVEGCKEVDCIYANDRLRLNFDQIADAIEYTYLREENECNAAGTGETAD